MSADEVTPRFSLDGRTALVTGASSGLGRHFARVLHAAGASVVLAARRVDRIEAEAAALGERARALAMDVADEASIAAGFERLAADDGRIDVDPQRVFDLGLPDELRETLRPERQFDRPFFGQLVRCRDLVARHVSRVFRCAPRRGGSHGIEYMPNERRKGDRLQRLVMTANALRMRFGAEPSPSPDSSTPRTARSASPRP